MYVLETAWCHIADHKVSNMIYCSFWKWTCLWWHMFCSQSSSSTESDSLPFANENAGTIKQRAARPHATLTTMDYQKPGEVSGFWYSVCQSTTFNILCTPTPKNLKDHKPIKQKERDPVTGEGMLRESVLLGRQVNKWVIICSHPFIHPNIFLCCFWTMSWPSWIRLCHHILFLGVPLQKLDKNKFVSCSSSNTAK